MSLDEVFEPIRSWYYRSPNHKPGHVMFDIKHPLFAVVRPSSSAMCLTVTQSSLQYLCKYYYSSNLTDKYHETSE